MSTGMTWDQVQDQLDLPSLGALTSYWEGSPPLHVMVASYFGIEPKKKTDSGPKVNDEKTLAELMAAFPGGER